MNTVALVGSDTLLGREIRDIVGVTEPGFDLSLIASDDEEAGALTRVGDEAVVTGTLNAKSLSGARAVFLAGTPESSLQTLKLMGDPPEEAIIDLTFVAEERPAARLRAPMVEDEPEEPADA